MVSANPPQQAPEFLRMKDVTGLLGVSSVTIWRWRKEGNFPEPHRIGANSVGWPRSTIEDWLASRAPAT